MFSVALVTPRLWWHDIYEVTNKEGPDADLPLLGGQVKVKDIQPVEATVPIMKYFPRLPGQSPQPIVLI